MKLTQGEINAKAARLIDATLEEKNEFLAQLTPYQKKRAIIHARTVKQIRDKFLKHQ